MLGGSDATRKLKKSSVRDCYQEVIDTVNDDHDDDATEEDGDEDGD